MALFEGLQRPCRDGDGRDEGRTWGVVGRA